jgi:hypothetical protein
MHPLSSFEAPTQISGVCDDTQTLDTFGRVALTVLSASFTPRREGAAGGGGSLHAGMM